MTEENSAAAGGEEQQGNPEIEARALSMGWMPKDRFPGDPEKWTSAEEFVNRAETLMPILKAQLRKGEARLRETQEQVKLLLEDRKLIHKRAYDDAMRDIVSRQAEAISRGDGAAYAQLEEMKGKLNDQAAPNVQTAPAGPPPEFYEWKQQNAWYGADDEMTEAADAYGIGLSTKHPNMPLSEIYEKTAAHIRQAYAHKLAPQRRAPAAVEGGGRPASSKGKSYSNLPADAKAACDRFVKQKLMTQEQYVKEFFGEE